MTLDENGRLDNLPFMPEMFAFCGKKFQVYKRAHKTCDTVAIVRLDPAGEPTLRFKFLYSAALISSFGLRWNRSM